MASNSDIEFDGGWRESFVYWFRDMCYYEAVYSRKYGDFERANMFNQIVELYDGSQNGAWYAFHATQGNYPETDVS